MRRPGGVVAGLLACSLLFAPDPGISAQEVSLERVESLVQAGRTEEARSILTRWTEAVEGNAPRLDIQRAIWLRAILTVDPDLAARDFRRLLVEFPGGGWTDRALLRLARYAEARGDLVGAARHHRTLVRDHPGSPARLEARSWLEENAGAIAAAERRGGRDVVGSVTPPEPIETETAPASLGKSAGYADRSAAADADTLGPAGGAIVVDSIVEPVPVEEPVPVVEPVPVEDPVPVEEPTAAEEEPRLDFTVQLGAFAADRRARELLRRVEESGFEARLVSIPGSELVRVRVGRFPDPEEATRVYDRLIESGFDAVVVADAAREEAPR